MKSHFHTRVNLSPDYADLLDAVIPETDPRHDDCMAVMGTDFFAEAHATPEARDAAVGPANRYVEFIAVEADEIEVVGYPLSRMAIGPAPAENGFDDVAKPILAAVIDHFRDVNPDGCGMLTITIARVQYTAWLDNSGRAPSILMAPLFGAPSTERHERTADWLAGYLFAELGAAAA